MVSDVRPAQRLRELLEAWFEHRHAFNATLPAT